MKNLLVMTTVVVGGTKLVFIVPFNDPRQNPDVYILAKGTDERASFTTKLVQVVMP